MNNSTVYLVEDDQAVRESIVWMLNQNGFEVAAFPNSSSFLDAIHPQMRGCLVIDLKLPQMNGLELYDRVTELGCRLPFMVITGHGEIRDATTAMRKGAVDFIEKPLDQGLFLNRIAQAIELDSDQQKTLAIYDDFKTRIDRLTAREAEVLDEVVSGRLTKQIAKKLNIAIKTVEVHRSNITRKMKVESVVQLVRAVIRHRFIEQQLKI